MVALPPIAQQEKIAEVLTDIDELIESLEELINKKRLIKQGAMQELLTGKRRLKGFNENKSYKQTELGLIPEDWKVKTIEDLCLPNGLVRGPFGGSLTKECFVSSGYKVYEQKNAIYKNYELGEYFIDKKKFNELIRFEIKPNDFIISCSGTIGQIYQIPVNAPAGIINQALLRISIDESKTDYFYFYQYFTWEFFQLEITENTQGGAMKNLVGMSVFKNTKIPLPTKEEQGAIASILTDMDREIEGLEEKLEKYRQIKQGMMEELLTGKIQL